MVQDFLLSRVCFHISCVAMKNTPLGAHFFNVWHTKMRHWIPFPSAWKILYIWTEQNRYLPVFLEAQKKSESHQSIHFAHLIGPTDFCSQNWCRFGVPAERCPLPEENRWGGCEWENRGVIEICFSLIFVQVGLYTMWCFSNGDPFFFYQTVPKISHKRCNPSNYHGILRGPKSLNAIPPLLR